MIVRTSVCIFILIIAISVYPQFPGRFSRISIGEGLSQSVALDILQDPAGFLWAATQDGLNLYDGNAFTVFRHHPNNTSTIPDNWINAMAWQKGCLWLATENNGLGKFIPSQNKCDLIPVDFNSPVRTLLFGSSGLLYAGTGSKGLFAIDPVSMQYKNFINIKNDPSSLSDNRIHCIYQDGDGILWIGTGAGVDKLNEPASAFIHYSPARLAAPEDAYSVNTIFEDKNNRLWIGTNKGLFYFEKSSGKFKPARTAGRNQIIAEYISCGFSDSRGNIWFGTMQNGLFCIQACTERSDCMEITCRNFTLNPLDKDGINCNYIRKIFEDNSGNLWVGTWGGGLNKLDLKPAKFSTINAAPASAIRLHMPYVRAVYDDAKGSMLIGLDGGGIEYYNRRTGTNRYLKFDSGRPDGNDLNYIYTFYKDNDNTVWIGTFAGLLSWPAESPDIQRLYSSYKYNNRSFNAPYIRAVAQLNSSSLLLGSGAGLAVYNKNTGSGFFPDSTSSGEKIPRLSITSMVRQGNDVLWIGTPKGLYKFMLSGSVEPKGFVNTFSLYAHDENKRTSISSNKVNCLLIDKDNALWIGTNLGLNKYDPAKNEFIRYFAADGLPNEIINGLLEDNAGNIWASTNNGLSRITKTAGGLAFRNYDEADGLQSNEFNQGACLKSASGELFFGGINGLSYFSPDKAADNPNQPRLAFTKVKIGSRQPETALGAEGNGISMKYSDGSVTFYFASLDFTNPGKNLYSYMLEGFDNEWSQPGRFTQAHYTNLSPGRYTFKVRGSNNDGVWNNAGISCKLYIAPSFWMTWWFRSLVVLLIALVSAALVRYRINRIVEIERLRMKIAADLHDEIGSSFTTITMYAAAMQNEDETGRLKSKAEKIEEISRGILGSLSDIVWSIDARNDSAGDLIDRMRDFLNSAFAESECKYKFSFSGIDEKKKLEITARQNIYLIFKEAVNNAIKHSGGNLVKIALDNSDSGFLMTIRDNGRGLPESKNKRGNGLKNMNLRARKLNGDISITSDEGVTVTLKTKKI